MAKKPSTPPTSSEEELREERAFFRQVIDLNPNFIFAKDREGRFTLVNQAVAEAYGTTVEELIGKTDADFNPNQEEVEHFRKFDLEVMDSKKEIIIPEEMITDANGAIRWLQTVKRAIVDPTGVSNQVLGVSTDITERKRSEQKLSDLQDELRHSQKMEAIGSLAGGIAHDFNNLLTAIVGFADILPTCASQPDEVVRTADSISKAAKRAVDLTSQLLGFARRGKHQNVPVDIHMAITEVAELLKRTLEKSIVIEQQFRARRFHVKGDPVQIQQILINLAINARDALECVPDGRLCFETEELMVQSAELPSYGVKSEGGYLRICVVDNGCGIDPALQHRVFEPFFTTKEAGKGTGMGLAMVYGIVHNHGGTISLKSTPDRGSRFEILLPLTDCKENPESPSRDSTVIKGRGHILLVDDESIVREVGSAMLTRLGYTNHVASNGLEAVKIYLERWKEFDLVIIDMIMPQLPGRECFLELKRINPHIRAILCTGYGRNLAAQRALDEGFSGFIQKPYRMAELSQVISQVLSSKK